MTNKNYSKNVWKVIHDIDLKMNNIKRNFFFNKLLKENKSCDMEEAIGKFNVSWQKLGFRRKKNYSGKESQEK